MQHMNIEEAKDHLPDLIDAAVKGEEIVITKDDQHRVKLGPIHERNLVRNSVAAKA
jgi:antitoxin (DNA-binding transcriptional repressor) of toxin-antitoxin stability system